MSEEKISKKFNTLVDLLCKKNSDEAKRLITADPLLLEYVDENGRLAVHWAASSGCLLFIQFLVDKNEDLVLKKDESSWTPLMIASSAGHFDIVKYLLSFPLTNVNHRNLNGQTPLHYACSKNHFDIAKLLIENGAEINVQDRFGATPLHRAASQENREKIVQLLINSSQAKVDLVDSEGNSPLHCACEDGNENIALYLIRNGGADGTLLNKEKKTPIDLAKTNEFKHKLQAALSERH